MSKLDEAFQPTPIDDEVEHAQGAVNINGSDLRSELERSASDIAHYGFRFARAHRRWLQAKIRVKEVEAAANLQWREEMEALGEKFTEASIVARVTKEKLVREAHAEQIEAEFEREQLKAMCDALRAKRDNLTSLVLLARAEMGGASWRDPSQDTGGSDE